MTRVRRIKLDTLLKESELPDKLRDVVKSTVQSTRLWRREKADVSAELISHFRDGLKLGQTQEDLIRLFGDVKQTARLISRARKRLRPLPWRIVRRGVQATAVFFCFYMLGIVYFIMGQPDPKVDYLALLNTKSVAVANNESAWPMYRAALLALGTPVKNNNARPGEEDWDEMATYLNMHVNVFADVRRAALRPGLGYVMGFERDPQDFDLQRPVTGVNHKDSVFKNSLMSILLPHLGELQRLAKLLVLDAHRAATEGDIETVLADIEAALGIANHVREAPLLISDLIGNSIASNVMITVGELLATHAELFNDDQLRQLAHRLSITEPLFDIRFDGVRYFWRDFVQRIYTDDGDGDGRLTARGLTALEYLMISPTSTDQPPSNAGVAVLAGPLLLATVMSRREALELHEKLLSKYEAAAELPMWEWGSGPGIEADNQLTEWMNSTLDNVRYFPLVMLMPASGHAAKIKQKGLAHRDAVLVAIALEIDRRRRGSWASQLTDLVPDLLPAIPPDRFNGQPIRYAIVDGGPVIYSVGNDRDDDGGRRSKQGRNSWYDSAARWTASAKAHNAVDADWVLWPPAQDE